MVEPGKSPYVFDAETRTLRINGKVYTLTATEEVIADYGSRVATAMGVGSAIREAIDGFARGEWVSYANAGDKIKALNLEAKEIKRQIEGLSAEFSSFFDPAGVQVEFAESGPAFHHFVKALLRIVAEGGLKQEPPAAPPAPAAVPTEAPVTG